MTLRWHKENEAKKAKNYSWTDDTIQYIINSGKNSEDADDGRMNDEVDWIIIVLLYTDNYTGPTMHSTEMIIGDVGICDDFVAHL